MMVVSFEELKDFLRCPDYYSFRKKEGRYEFVVRGWKRFTAFIFLISGLIALIIGAYKLFCGAREVLL